MEQKQAAHPLIEMEGLTKVYRMGETEVHALRGISLTIEDGEYVAIVGASGSGKSTLMNVIGLLDRPSQGVYRLRGEEVSRIDRNRQADLRNADMRQSIIDGADLRGADLHGTLIR